MERQVRLAKRIKQTLISGHQQGRVDLGLQVWGQSIRRKKIQKKKIQIDIYIVLKNY